MPWREQSSEHNLKVATQGMAGSLLPTPEVRGPARGHTVLRAAKATAAPVQLAGRGPLLH